VSDAAVVPTRPPRLALSKSLHPSDYALLDTELAFVDHLGVAGQATDHRRWEYAMALYVWTAWEGAREDRGCFGYTPVAIDVGGAGSPFAEVFRRWRPGVAIEVVDPSVNCAIEDWPEDEPLDAVFCVSTLEHIPEPKPFLRACVTRLRPGGLLFLTVDYWDCEGPDTAHFHWMRKRIYNRTSLEDVRSFLKTLRVQRFGGVDTRYHGNHVYGTYTFASLALRKEP
jgi:SAM-dependent methyltransferase